MTVRSERLSVSLHISIPWVPKNEMKYQIIKLMQNCAFCALLNLMEVSFTKYQDIDVELRNLISF